MIASAFSRLAILKQAIETGYKYIITERCLDTDKHIFCQMLYDDGFINEIEFQIYNNWYDTFITKHEYKTTTPINGQLESNATVEVRVFPMFSNEISSSQRRNHQRDYLPGSQKVFVV